MSKHRHEECCYGGGYGAVAYGGGGAGSGFGGFNKWIYALLILIVIVLQFGRRRRENGLIGTSTGCDDGGVVAVTNKNGEDFQEIDNSVLFIIIVFLLVICAGCGSGIGGFGGGYGN